MDAKIMKLATDLFNDNFKEISEFHLTKYRGQMVELERDDKSSNVILLYSSSTVVEVHEYANFELVNTDDLNEVMASVLRLSEQAALSYAFNVINTAIRDRRWGRTSVKLYTIPTALKFNIMQNTSGLSVDSLDPAKGWVSYRYMFAAEVA